MKSRLSTCFLTAAFCLTVGIGSPAHAEDLDIAQTPLFVAVNVSPNIIFTLDDSGSMQWEGMPVNWAYIMPQAENPYGGVTYGRNIPRFNDNYFWNLRLRNPQQNGVFYNPELEYKPWARANGTSFPDADPDAALRNPDLPDRGALDLDSLNIWNNWSGGGPNDTGDNNEFWPITFYIYDGVGNINVPGSYTKYQIRENRAYTATPANAPMVEITQFPWPVDDPRSVEEEKQNFANWFSYSRSRVLAARNGIGRAFAELPQRARVGFGAINQGVTSVDGVNTGTLIDGVRPFAGTFREEFYDQLYGRVINNFGTPLRRAAGDVGEYFEREDARGPWSTTPGVDGGTDLACRQSYHILMTDGDWNGGGPGVDNSDNLAGPTHTSPEGDTYTYTPSDPFRDNNANTLGDVAMEYWKRDLRTDLDNRVPTNDADPGFWQHLTTYGIGLGVRGNLDPDTVFQAVEDGTAIAWGDPFNNQLARIDDLLHFGVNGRGGYFSARDPDAFAAQLGAILADIAARANSTTGVSVSATRLTTDSLIYAAEFDSEGWSGELTALNAEDSTVERRASEELEILGADNRDIFSYDPATNNGVVFDAASDIVDRVLDPVPLPITAGVLFDYLRGDLTAGAGLLRPRDSMMGDIVNSRPVFSGAGNEGWARIDASYLDYIDEDKRDSRDPCFPAEDPCPGSRNNTVFVGSNGGMLHAFDAKTLEEHFAYVPSAVHENLWELANPSYSHRFFVDGQVAVADAKDGAWKTVLVGGLGAGGRGIYALDVTKPQSFTEANVLWEFTAEDDPDLGFTFGEPLISRLSDGTWVAVFGNGYNSEDGQAYLYVVDLFNGPEDDGSVLHKIPLGAAGSNGLSGVAGWRDAGTRTFLDRVYAGDLNGTIWRVDFTTGSPDVKYNDGLFTDPDNRAITSTPSIAANPGGGLNLYFGTGKLIESSDRLEVEMERFFSIRDLNSPVTNTNDLSEGTITSVPGEPDFRAIENPGDGPEGWFLDLALGSATGERVISKAIVQFGVLIIATYEPVEDPCTPGGIQRLYVLDALTGNGSLPFCTNCGAVEVGIGAPISPPIVIKQQERSVVDGVIDFPGNIDPNEPEDPGTPPDASGDPLRDDWCSVYGIPPVIEGASFIQLGTICEGRQVWLQRR